MESKSYCENKLNRLMMPSIFLSTAATVLSAIVTIVNENYGSALMHLAVAFLILTIFRLSINKRNKQKQMNKLTIDII